MALAGLSFLVPPCKHGTPTTKPLGLPARVLGKCVPGAWCKCSTLGVCIAPTAAVSKAATSEIQNSKHQIAFCSFLFLFLCMLERLFRLPLSCFWSCVRHGAHHFTSYCLPLDLYSPFLFLCWQPFGVALMLLSSKPRRCLQPPGT